MRKIPFLDPVIKRWALRLSMLFLCSLGCWLAGRMGLEDVGMVVASP